MKNDLISRIAMATAHVIRFAGLLDDGDQIKSLFGKFDPIEPRKAIDPLVIEQSRAKMRALCTNPVTKPEMANAFSSVIVLSALMVMRELSLKAGITSIDTSEKLVSMMEAICERGEKYHKIEDINEGAGDAAVELCELLVENYKRDELLEIIGENERGIFRTNLR